MEDAYEKEMKDGKPLIKPGKGKGRGRGKAKATGKRSIKEMLGKNKDDDDDDEYMEGSQCEISHFPTLCQPLYFRLRV